MSYSEKSSWLMCVSLGLAALFYGNALIKSMKYDESIQLTSLTITYIVIIVLISIIGHIVATVSGSKDIQVSEDERDKKISIQSNSISNYILGFGAVSGLMHYLVIGNGDLLFHFILASLTLSAIVEYALRIYFYRTVI